MKFQPKTDDEIKRAMCAAPGTYDFEVANAVDGFSKVKEDGSGGNPMTTLTLRVFVGQSERTVKDFLMEKLQFKLKHFMYSVGFGAEYEAGGLDAALLIGRAGKLVLAIQEQEGYGPKNVVKDYVSGVKGETEQPKAPITAPRAAVTSGSEEPPF